MPGTADPAALDEVARRAEAAWREVAPAGGGPEALLRHGRRVGRVVLSAASDDAEAARAVTVAALLHEAGRFVPGAGHYAARGARFAAIRLDDVLPGATELERRLVGEMILFHRHRGPLPEELPRPDLVDRFRHAEAADRTTPDGPLAAILRRSDLTELLRHPILTPRTTRIRRPDR